MGRHVSSRERGPLRRALAAALAGILVLTGAAGLAGYAIWRHEHGAAPERSAPRAMPRIPAVTSSRPVIPTLVLTVTGARCQVFVGVPGGDILVNRTLTHGESVRFTDPRLDVVLDDGGAVRVEVNGRPRVAASLTAPAEQAQSGAGGRVAFTVARPQAR